MRAHRLSSAEDINCACKPQIRLTILRRSDGAARSTRRCRFIRHASACSHDRRVVLCAIVVCVIRSRERAQGHAHLSHFSPQILRNFPARRNRAASSRVHGSLSGVSAERKRNRDRNLCAAIIHERTAASAIRCCSKDSVIRGRAKEARCLNSRGGRGADDVVHYLLQKLVHSPFGGRVASDAEMNQTSIPMRCSGPNSGSRKSQSMPG